MSPSLLAGALDVVLVAVIGVYAVSGWRSGLARAGFTIVGFFLGVFVGVTVVPGLLERVEALRTNTRLRFVLLLVSVLLLGWAGQSLGAFAGARVAARLRAVSARRVDSGAGAVLVGGAAALVLFLLAGALRLAGSPGVSSVLSRSQVLTVVGAIVPQQTDDWLARGRTYLTDNGFPQVFGGPGPEPIAPISAPEAALIKGEGVARAQRSIIKVTADAPACSRALEGTGWVAGPDRIITNAHVVAGASRVTVEVDSSPRRASVVLFDPDKDLAVLKLDDLGLAQLPRGDADVPDGTGVVVAGYPLDGPYTVRPGRVRDTITATGRDIYGAGRVVRDVYSVRAVVQPGNSGGPLLDAQGRVVGVVFASSLEDAETGYALTLDEISPELRRLPTLREPVDTGRCLVS